MDFPKHFTMSIEHNPHKNYYQDIKQYLSDHECYKDVINSEDLKICIQNDELWVIHWYPHNPISFYAVLSYSLEKCLELANNVEK